MYFKTTPVSGLSLCCFSVGADGKDTGQCAEQRGGHPELILDVITL